MRNNGLEFSDLSGAKDYPKVSIIVPFYKARSRYLEECIQRCLELDHPDFEIIVVSNEHYEASDPKVKAFTTDKLSQGEKDDVGISVSSGEICAFINDDAYPRRDWLKNAVKYFQDPEVGAVGGPGLTPENDGLMQKASGAVYASFLGAGFAAYRCSTPRSPTYIDDCPGHNLIVKKGLLERIGGFGTRFRSGEDTALSLKIIKASRKIVYAPDVIVFHHRKPLFRAHMRQARSCGMHRGYYVKKFPETSFRASYFLPSFLVFSIMALATILALDPSIAWPLLVLLGVYVLFSFASGFISNRSLKIALLFPAAILATHVAYGVGFLQGLMTFDENRLTWKE